MIDNTILLMEAFLGNGLGYKVENVIYGFKKGKGLMVNAKKGRYYFPL